MDSTRAKRVFDKMSKATMKELDSWNTVEYYAKVISDTPEIQKPLKRPEVKGFKFEQRYNKKKAKEAQDWLISQLGL